MGKPKRIIYIKGIPYRNWYFKLPVMSDEEEEKVHQRILQIKKKKGL
jgi:hypothetical protein